MHKMVRYALGAITVLVVAAVLAALTNASYWSAYRAPLVLLAHRGVAQTYSRQDLKNDTCTADRIHPPTHPYLENTIASMRAAFDAGADIVEFDIHATTDGHFAVFHDWTIDCRTEGRGVTHEQTLTYLKTLDIGYGYTADRGKTFPFRGRGVGLMPSLDEVLAAFPDKRFLINVKSNFTADGDRLADRLLKLSPAQLALLMSYGGERPMARLRERIPGIRTTSQPVLIECMTNYLALGWSGKLPAICRNSIVLVPVDRAWLLWGWPNRFMERMSGAGAVVFVRGPYSVGESWGGLNKDEEFDHLPEGFSGGVWTDRIEYIAPKLGRRPRVSAPP
jgi:glycerophosphoryl diester phosphodiesterase